MAASMETLGIGGHEYFAEKIFEKVKALPNLKLVELTKNEYDALTPTQKADPTKLYLVPGDGKYLKFQEISAADYEALSQEAKMDPYTVYMTPGDGTYFRVIDISQEDYDALSSEEKANPNNLYLIPGDDVEYLTKTVADTLYAGINDIPDVSGLLSKTEAASTYQTIAGMSSYLTSSTAASTYLSKTDAANTYISKAEFPDEVRNPIDVYKDTVVTFDNGIDNGPMNRCAVYLYPQQTWNDDEPPSPENFCPINGRHNFTLNLADSTSSQNPTTFPVEFANKVSGFDGIVYGGYYDFITGDLIVTHIKKVFDGTETLYQYQEFTPDEHRVFKYKFESADLFYTTNVSLSNTYCTHYEPVNPRNDTFTYMEDLECCFVNEDSDGVTSFRWLHNDITSINNMKTYLAEQYANLTPLAIVGTLQIPIIYQIGPTHIRTLECTNYLWISGDTGSEIEVEVISENFDKVIAQMLNDNTDNTIIVNAERPSGAVDDSSLTASMSLREMEELLENGYDISIKYTYEEYVGLGNLLYREVQYLRLKTYQMWTQYTAGTAQSSIIFTSNDSGYEYKIQAISGSDSTTLTKITI